MRDGLGVATLRATEPSYESEGSIAVQKTKEQPLKRGQSYVLTLRSRVGVTKAKRRKGREMRTSDTILGLLRERGSKGLPLERVYRLLYSPDLYLTAYGKIYQIWTARPLVPLHTLLSTLVHILTKNEEFFVT